MKQSMPEWWWDARNKALTNNTIIPTLHPDLHSIDCCVVADIQSGVGVYSWHACQRDAQHNAAIIGGRAVPVDSVDGQVIMPAYAKAVIKRRWAREERGF